MQKIYTFSLALFLSIATIAQNTTVASFEDTDIPLPLDTFVNNFETTGSFTSGNAIFPNVFNPDFGGYWAGGWAISTMRDDSTSGFENLHSVITGGGLESNTYALGQQNSIVRLNESAQGKIVKGLYITNTTYAHNSMRDGDDFAKKFGGEDGTEPDFYRLEIQKYSQGTLQTPSVEFYLADFRFEDDSLDYIVKDWQWVDLSSLGNVDSLLFTLYSSDIGDYGINTPLFFAIDNLETSEVISTSIHAIESNNTTFAVYPNPAIATITINLNAIQDAYTIQLFDLLGRNVKEQRVTDPIMPTLDITDLEKGTYILQIRTKNGRVVSDKFVKNE